MWWGWDECQGSEGVNKTPRQSGRKCVARVHPLSRNKLIYLSIWKKRWVGWDGGKQIISGCMHMTWTVMELAGKRFSQIIQWCRGGLRVAEKVSKVSKRNQYPLTTIYGQERKWMVGVSCNDTTRDSVVLGRKRDSVFGLITRHRWGSITRYNLVGAA